MFALLSGLLFVPTAVEYSKFLDSVIYLLLFLCIGEMLFDI